MPRSGRLTLTCVLTLVLAPFVVAQTPGPSERPLTYPPAAKGDVVDEYHGTRVPDPYRWLEELDSPATRAWIEAQNQLTFAYLSEIPAREKIRERLTKLWNYERYSIPRKEGGRYFFSRNDGLQPQSVLYVMDSLDGSPRELLNPNTLSPDGTIALSGTFITEDAKLMAYGLSSGGSDWVELKVRDVDSGRDLGDHLKWIKFSGAAWTRDAEGFFYSRYDEPKGDRLAAVNKFQKLYYHRLGTPQSEDRLVYQRDDQPEWGFGGEVTDDGRYLIISVWQGTERRNRVYYQDLQTSGGEVVRLLDDFDAQYDFIDNDGPVFWFRTDQNASRYRVIALDTRHPSRENWQELIPESEDTLQSVSAVGDMFFCTYLHDAHSRVKVFDLSGKFVREVELPGIGTASGFGGRRKDRETFYSFTSFTTPVTIYRYDIPTGRSEVFRQPKVDFDPASYETHQVFYNSKDGTRIPMFLVHRRDIRRDGSNPTFLWGYGGFNVSITPSFSVSHVVWMEMGGVVAIPNLRGGGEYGKEWYEAGRLRNKQNVFDDFLAAAEWLILNRYTTPEKLAIGGGSNGGLLVGAVMTQRPNMFAAAVPQVGVFDMLRFDQTTIGWAWRSDYGNPNDPNDPNSLEDFRTNLAYSPLHNVRPGTRYPATLLTTGDHDDRVVPWHTFKFTAALQAAQAGPKPILVRVETRAGHGAGKPTAKIIEETADRLAFLTRVLGMEVPPRTESTN